MQFDARADVAYLVWLSGGGCDGCVTSVMSAADPGLEDLLLGHIPDAPKLEIIHPNFFYDSGTRYHAWLSRAAAGQLGSFVLVVDGALYDEKSDGQFGCITTNEAGETVTTTEWLTVLAPQAAAVIALGSCATWGGIPAAGGGAAPVLTVNRVVGHNYQSGGSLPVINLPGCAPTGSGLVETLTYVYLHLAQLVPLELDQLGRPVWLYNKEAYPMPPRADYQTAAGYDLTGRPVTLCPVPTHGWTQSLGGCTRIGGGCIACTEPDFADPDVGVVAARRRVNCADGKAGRTLDA